MAIMLELGLRRGELIDLTCLDIDMEKKEVSVNHQLIYKDFGDGCRFHVNSPKTKSGKERRTPVLLPKISGHSLRHTACTNMAKHDMNIKILQYIMGHAHSDVTMDVFNHIAGVEDIKEEIIKYEKVINT